MTDDTAQTPAAADPRDPLDPPRAAALLGYAGAIPFITAAVIVFFLYPRDEAQTVLAIQIGYGAVILSFLGLGVRNEPSWGIMINHARQEVINGFFWQIGAATFFMLVLVLAFNTLSDALQDAFDPKHV